MTDLTSPTPRSALGRSLENVILLASRPASHSMYSGYQRLPDYLPGASVITGGRQDPKSRFKLLLARVSRKLAFSRWYLGSSAAMEWECLKRARHAKPGIVHFLWAELDLGFLDLFLRLRGGKVVGSFHNCSDTIADVIRFPRRLRNFSAVILMSETQRPYMNRAGVPDKRIHVVPHGVDVDFFKPNLNRRDEGFRVLTVGGYRRDFGRLREFCIALRQFSEIRVHIVGPAGQRSAFDRLDNVAFLSSLNDEQLLQEYQNASCFVMMVENATANNAMLEALACGLPVIADRVGGIAEYLDPSSSFVVDPNRMAETVDAVASLWKSRALAVEMAANARAKALEYRWEAVAERTRQVYDSASR